MHRFKNVFVMVFGASNAQVVPPYDRLDYPTVDPYRKDLAKYYPDPPPTFVSLEGFVDAMVLVEGLSRAGKDPTREKFIAGVAIDSRNEPRPGIRVDPGLWASGAQRF
jgi:branched-chain amino acid transport system substrate-binding protein